MLLGEPGAESQPEGTEVDHLMRKVVGRLTIPQVVPSEIRIPFNLKTSSSENN